MLTAWEEGGCIGLIWPYMVPLRFCRWEPCPTHCNSFLLNFQAEDEQIAENFVLGLSRLCHLDPIWQLDVTCGLYYLVFVCRVFIFSPGHFRHFGVPSSKKNKKDILNTRSQSKSFVCLYSVTWCLHVDMTFCCKYTTWIQHDLTFATILRALRSWDQIRFEKPLAGATCIRRGSWTWHPTQNLHKMRRFDTRSLW